MSADLGAQAGHSDEQANEQARLAKLRSYAIFDSAPERLFDDIAKLAAQICGTPIAAVSFVDGTRQWFMAEVGLGVRETPRDVSFCAHAILAPDDARPARRAGGSEPPGRRAARRAHHAAATRRRAARAERAEAEAATATDRFRQVFEASPIAMAIADGDGVLREVNDTYVELLGYTREYLIGRTATELMADDDINLAGLGVIDRTDVREVNHRHADGHLLPTLVFTSVIRDADGVVVAQLGQVESIAERLAATELLLEAQSAVDAIITIDDRGRVVSWNAGAERMFGYARAEMLARPVRAIVPTRFQAQHDGGVGRLRAGGGPTPGEPDRRGGGPAA